MERNLNPSEGIPASKVSEGLKQLGYCIGATPRTDTNPERHVHFVRRAGPLEFHWVFRRINERLKPNNFYVAMIDNVSQLAVLEAKRSEILRLQHELQQNQPNDDPRPLLRNLESALYFASPIKSISRRAIKSGTSSGRKIRRQISELRRKQEMREAAQRSEE